MIKKTVDVTLSRISNLSVVNVKKEKKNKSSSMTFIHSSGNDYPNKQTNMHPFLRMSTYYCTQPL